MDAREKMRKWRQDHCLTLSMISRKCDVSAELLSIIEEGGVSHPSVVERIRRFYGLTDEEAEQLLPEHRRPNGGDYEPDRYYKPPLEGADKIMPRQSGIDKYFKDHWYDHTSTIANRRRNGRRM